MNSANMVAIAYKSSTIEVLEFVKAFQFDLAETIQPLIDAQKELIRMVQDSAEQLRETLRQIVEYISELVAEIVDIQTSAVKYSLTRVIRTNSICEDNINNPSTAPPSVAVRLEIGAIFFLTWINCTGLPYLKKAFIAFAIEKIFEHIF